MEFINDGTARQFVNAGTSAGAQAAWLQREHGAKARQDSDSAMKASKIAAQKDDVDSHTDAATAHLIAAAQHKYSGTGPEKVGFHKAQYFYHVGKAEEHLKNFSKNPDSQAHLAKVEPAAVQQPGGRVSTFLSRIFG